MATSTANPASADAQAYLEKVFAIWRKAQVVHQAPSWDGKPEARALAEEIAATHPEHEAALAAALADESALVVAYALISLELMNSRCLQKLPDALLQRRSNITLIAGSFKSSMDLGGLARQIQKHATERLAASIKQP
jgi:hypothetical protein